MFEKLHTMMKLCTDNANWEVDCPQNEQTRKLMCTRRNFHKQRRLELPMNSANRTRNFTREELATKTQAKKKRHLQAVQKGVTVYSTRQKKKKVKKQTPAFICSENDTEDVGQINKTS